jgi:hypothetical protein
VSTPNNPRDFFKAVPFLAGLNKIGNVVLLMPQDLEQIRSFMKPKQFEIIIYEKCPTLFSEDFKRVAVQLGQRYFHFLIELNKPANTSLPYLGNFQRRVSFYDRGNFPYYNILMKDGYASLSEFFNIRAHDDSDIFHFYSRDLKALEKKLRKKRPLLFVNGAEDIEWKGGKIVLGQDIMADDANIWKALYITDAYCGEKDAFYEFARLNRKKLLTQ